MFEALESRVLLSVTLPPTLIVGTADSDDDLTAPAIYGTLAGEPIDGLAGDDAIYGDGGQTGGGDDVITGGDGRDYLDGEDGNDLLEPGPMDSPVTANQTVRGGEGTDTLFLRGFPADHRSAVAACCLRYRLASLARRRHGNALVTTRT
jgi:hypothetical protein